MAASRSRPIQKTVTLTVWFGLPLTAVRSAQNALWNTLSSQRSCYCASQHPLLMTGCVDAVGVPRAVVIRLATNLDSSSPILTRSVGTGEGNETLLRVLGQNISLTNLGWGSLNTQWLESCGIRMGAPSHRSSCNKSLRRQERSVMGRNTRPPSSCTQ